MRFSIFVALSFTGVALAQSQEWGQCGGIGWNGATTCVSGTVCTVLNAYYSQCLPGTATTTTTTNTGTTTTVTSSAPGSTTTGLNIRLLPLGDSITYGLESTDGNGYRNALHNLLQPGNTVDFIGSLKAGTMVDNDNEGHSGYTIAQIQSVSTNSLALPARPNVVLLMAGTNDVFGGSISTAPSRLSTLIDSIFSACPDTALIVATLTPLPSGQAAVDTYNAAVTQLVAQRQAAGQHIVLASMSAILASDLADGVHPNNAGYVKMANAWYPAIQQAAAKGWIGTPVKV
ncbi:Lipolytic enzyme [Mycena sanguinolenta]|uniref:Lipolytic enzyme n=1 Tax=Mycena sanguinolenta TaxID=230812 RepID=A0A8H6Z071_9AGAR|nr:Lipolytic enzyme [Mycena sanguinolenta]